MLACMAKRSLPFLLLLLGPIAEAQLPRFDVSKMDSTLGQWLEQARSQTESLLESDDVPNEDKAAAIGGLGQTYYAFDLLEPALTCFEQAQDFAPDGARWHYLAGLVASTLGRSELARINFEQAVRTEEAALSALVALADLHLAGGRPEVALPLYRQALQIEGGDAIGHFGTGRALAALGQTQEAAQHFAAVLKLQPEASAVHYPLARVLMALGRTADAERHLSRRGDRSVRYPDPVRGEIADVKALVAFQVVHSMAVQVEPRPPEHILRFALTYIGDLDGTVQAFENVMQRPDLQDAPKRQRAILHYVAGGVALRQELDTSAREHLEQAVALDPELIEPRILLGNQRAREGDFIGAIEHFSAAIEQRSTDTELLLKRATALLNANRTDDARADLEQILTAHPNHLQASIRLAELEEVEGRPVDADGRLAQLVNSHPGGEARLAVERAWAELERRRGRLPVAIEHLRKGLEAVPSDPSARLELARMLGGVEDLEGAEQEFARVLTAWPDHPGALQGRITALILLERYQAATDLLEDRALQPETPPALQIVLVRLLSAAPDAEIRKPRRALELARELVERTDEPLVIDSLAMAEAAVGNFSRAAELLQQIVTQEAIPAGARSRIELYRQNRPFIASQPEDLLPPPS